MIPCSDEEHYYKLDNIVLSSCQLLRQVFINRWKSETKEDWIDDEQQLKKFIDGKLGENVYKQAQKFQKSILKSTPVEEWDMSLLSLAIVNFGGEEEMEKYKVENEAVRKLRKMRNDLAHSGNKKVSKENYEANVDIFRSCMQSLGVESTEVQKLIDKSGVTSSLKALEYMNELHKKADQLLKDGQPETALETFSEAINVPSLLPINLGTAYEKRAECLLSAVSDPVADHSKIDAALLDATKVLQELNEFSWIAHYLCARCYRWKNELDQAIHHYVRALAISPAQEAVKDGYDTCKVLTGAYNRYDHLNPNLMPTNLQEIIDAMEKEKGVKMDKEQYLLYMNSKGSIIEGQDHVFHGHQYFRGWDVPQDYTVAANHYAKAAHQKNAEGMYNLAGCYHYGHGVKQEVREAMRIYRQVAEMDPHTPGKTTKLKRNVGVAAAQHAIGLMYEEGVGVEMDYVVAASWYKRAMENGLGNAANNLGRLYNQGLGISQDTKMAELCWKEAVNLKDAVAPVSLLYYYMNELELELALDMVRIGREMGSGILWKISDEEINRVFAQSMSQRARSEPELVQFEKGNNLHTKGLTFRERLNRKFRLLQPSVAKVEDIFTQGIKDYYGQQKSWSFELTKENILIMCERADQGSATASNAIKVLSLSNELDRLVNGYFEHDESLACKIVDLLYDCLTLEYYLIHQVENVAQKLKAIFARLFENCSTATGDEDMKIRLCYAVFNLYGSVHLNDMLAVEILKVGISKYPKNVHFYYYLSHILGHKQIIEEGRFYAQEGLKLFPDQVDLLFCLADQIQDPLDRIATYKKYLSVAAKDHRMVPEAYYQISYLLLLQCQDNEQLEKVKAYYLRGQEAEQDQLPDYLPYNESIEKRILKEDIVQLAFSSSPLETIPNVQAEPKGGILKKNKYLLSPTRKAIILMHREHLKGSEKTKLKRQLGLGASFTFSPKLKQSVATRMSKLKAINLQEMNPTQDQIYENRIMDVTIMDELTAEYTSIHLIAEDENGDMARLYLYNFPKDNETLQKFQPGCRLGIINPYMRIGAHDVTNGIRNDEPQCIVFLEKVENMCRLCGEGNASRKCSRCKRPYCSRECQVLDWKELKHKLICDLKW